MAARYHNPDKVASRSRVSFLAACLVCVLVGGAACADNAAPRDAWLQAPKSQGANWDRLALLERLLAGVDLRGKPRAKVLGLLGPPGYSAELYPKRSKIDTYRLSAVNDQSLRVDYDPGDAVSEDMIEHDPCSCDVCTDDAPAISAAVLDKNRLIGSAPREGTVTMSAFEKMLGGRGRLHLSHNQVGGQIWLDYVETWRVGGAPQQFLAVSGYVPVRDARMDEVGDKSAETWALVSFAPDCLAP